MKKYTVLFLVIIFGTIGIIKILNSISTNSTNNINHKNDVSFVDNVSTKNGVDVYSNNVPHINNRIDTIKPRDQIIKKPSITFMKNTGKLFSDFPYSSYAYRIFPTFESSDAKIAIDGFDIKKEDLGNNNYKVSLISKKKDYKTQTFIVSKNQKIYFIETSFGDDVPSQDYAYGDDRGIAVNEQGYILQ